MGFVNVFYREIQLLCKNKFILISMLVVPFIFCLSIASTFSSGSVQDLQIAVIDKDHSDLSRQIIRAVDATSSIKVKYHLDNEFKAREMLNSREIYALLIIPKNFSRDLSRLKVPSLSFYYNNQTMLIGGLLSKDLKTVLEGAKIKAAAAIKAKTGMTLKEVSHRINLVSESEHIHSNPYINYSYFIVYIAIAHTFQVFGFLVGAWTYGVELKKGLGKDLWDSSCHNIIYAIAGKASVYIIIMSMQIILCVSLFIIFGDAPFNGNLFFFIFNTIIYVASCLSVSLILTAILCNLRMVMSIVACCASLGYTMTGGTYPSMAMPEGIQIFSALLPVRSYASVLIGLAMQGHSFFYYVRYTVYLLLFILIGTLLYKKYIMNCQDPKLWHKI